MAEKFDLAVKIVQGLPKDGPVQPTSDDKLEFYKWYKVATVGKVDTARPGMLDFVGKAKWDAWKSVEDEEPATAKANYVAKLIDILKNASGDEAKEYLAQLEAA